MSWILWIIFIILGIAILIFLSKVIIKIVKGEATGENPAKTFWNACCETLGRK